MTNAKLKEFLNNKNKCDSTYKNNKIEAKTKCTKKYKVSKNKITKTNIEPFTHFMLWKYEFVSIKNISHYLLPMIDVVGFES